MNGSSEVPDVLQLHGFWYSGAAVFAVALFGSGIPVAMNKLQHRAKKFHWVIWMLPF